MMLKYSERLYWRLTVGLSMALLLLACSGDEASNQAELEDDIGVEEDISSGESFDSGNDAEEDAHHDAEEDTQNNGECGLPVPFDEGLTYERELFISPDGDDGSGHGSDANPFATLTAAASEATPGTKIVLREGTYEGGMWISNLRGEEGRPIAVVGEGEVIIEGGTNNIQFVEPRYLVVEGIIFQGATANGLNIDDGSTLESPAEYIVLRDLTVRDVGTGGNNDCIKLSGLRHFFVLDSEVIGCDGGQGIDMVGSHQGLISGNRIGEMAGPGIQAKGGSSDVMIHGNWMWNIGGRAINAGGSTGLEFFRPPDADSEAARIQMVSNVILDTGEFSGAPVAFVGCDGCLFAHNTVIRPQTWVARILQETTGERFVPARDGRFVNNIIALNVDDLRNGVYVNYSDNTDRESFIFGWNLWHALDRDESFAGPTYTGGIPEEVNSVIQQDPLFVDYDGEDFRLQAGSPAEGIGQVDILDEPFPDFDGRCFGEEPTVGAFARQ